MLCVSWVCFFLGRTLYRSSRDLMTLHRMMAISITIFTLPILYEIRMSPQISNMFYGFNPDAVGHGVPVGRLPSARHLQHRDPPGVVPAVLHDHDDGDDAGQSAHRTHSDARALRRICSRFWSFASRRVRLSTPQSWFRWWSLRHLVVCCGWRRIVTIVFVVYPAPRFYELIPTDAIVDLFTKISQDRADSLKYRFDMEKGMLDWVAKRPWWGWGGYSRGFVHDLKSGANLSIPDGSVIISLSIHGGVGFLTFFFPYVWALLRAPRFIKRMKSRTDRILISALCLNGAVVLLDLAFNSSFFPIYMFLLGAIYGLCPGIVAEEARTELLEAYASGSPYAPATSYALPR